MPTVSVSSAVSQESDGQFLSFEVTLSEAALDTVTLDYRAIAGTGNSFDLNWSFDRTDRTAGSLEFAPGVTSQTVFIEANSDSVDERDESIILQLTNLSENAEFDNGENTLRSTGVILDNDGVGSNLALFVSDPIITEGDSGTKQAIFEVRLSQPAPSDFTVNYRTHDITATAGEDYATRIGSLDFDTGDEVKFVSVPVFGDTTAEATESFSLVVDAPSGLTVGVDGLAGEATIRDDDTGNRPVVSVIGATALESDGQFMSFEIKLSEPALDTVVFQYRALADTGDSFDLNWSLHRLDRTRGTVEIPPGQTSARIFIEANSDSTDERDESITLQLTDLTENARFAGGENELRATGIILDDDGTGSNLALFVSSPVLIEGDSGAKEAVFDVRLSQPATTQVTVNYATRDISAVAGEDYVQTSGQLVFEPGEQARAVKVSVLGDAAPETTESFALVVTAPSSPSIGVDGLAGEATIRDDDSGRGPVVSITDTDSRESDGQFLAFEVTLSERSLETVRFDYRAIQGTADSYDLNWNFDRTDRTTGSVEFAPGELSRMIFIETNSDSTDERDESIVLKLTNLSETATFAGGGDSLTATGIIKDDDGSGSNLALLVSDVALVEGDRGSKQAEFIVTLSQPLAADLTVNYTTRDVTAQAGEDYVARSGALTFAPGEQRKAVRVDVLGDETAELTESFTLLLEAPEGVSLSEAGLAGQAVIRDDDTSPGPVIAVSDAKAREADGQFMAFEVSLSEASNAPVTLDYRAVEGTGGSADLNWGLDSADRTAGSITFDPGTVSRIIYIEANSDSEDERDETIFLELSNAVGGSFADGAPTVRAVGIQYDDDGLGPNRIVTVAPTILREQGAALAEYEVPIIMSQTASVELTFDVAALDRSAKAGIDFRLLDSSVTFLPGETRASVSVQVLGDAADEVTETFALSVAPQDGTPFVGTIPAGEITILNGPRIPTQGDDTLEGTSDPDRIDLLRGNDSYMGLAGDDTVFAGGGDDTVIGGSGDDELYGQSGNDLLVGGIGTNDVNSFGGQVYRIYRATLDRAPDSGGFEGWIAALESGTADIFKVTTGFVASREFQNVYGDLDNAGFVTLLYNNVLGRDPDAVGLTGWLEQLAAGVSREQVVIGFSESVEFKGVTGVAASAYTDAFVQRADAEFMDDVFRLYQATLNRAPDRQGLESWSGQLADGQDYVFIAGGFTNSTEFRNTYGAVNDNAFVNLLYQNVLGRDADPDGLASWLSQMASGLTREGVVRGFAESREFIRNTKSDFTAFMNGLEGDIFVGGSGNDTMMGGYAADTFEFSAGADGSNVVLQINPWDTVEFRDFGYESANDALTQMAEVGNDVRFSDEGVQITFAGADLALMTEVDYAFG